MIDIDKHEVSVEEIAEALVCLAKLILLVKRIGWPEDVGYLLELEDDLTELHQELR
ncbi:MAG: hypothetical protein JSV86_19920 [Gemmatimonadota bacterium]|nr:MAG: hypothetical protein JSV86_19920 [Gemmatimonadota bacterium]